MLKRILQLIVVLLIAAQGVMAQTVQIESVTKPPGDIRVQVDMLSFTDVAAITLKIEYNSSLMEFTGIDSTQLTGGWLANASGDVIMVTYTASPTGTGYDIDGKAFDLLFVYNGGFSDSLLFDESGCEITNSSLGTISSTYVNGFVTQSTALGTVSMTDLVDTVGNIVNMPINMQGAGYDSVGAMTLRIGYDDAQLSYAGIVGDALSGAVANAGNGVLEIEWSSPTPMDFSSLTHLLDIQFVYNGGNAIVAFVPGCEINNIYLLPIATDYTDGSVTAVAGVRTFTISSVGSNPGAAVAVPVQAGGFATDSVGAITMLFTYDNALLTYTSYNADQLTGWTVNNSTPGELEFQWADANGSLITDGSLLTLNFVYDVDSTGDTANIAFAPGTIVKDKQLVVLPVTLSDGSVYSDYIVAYSVSGHLSYMGDTLRPIGTDGTSTTTVYLRNAADSSVAYFAGTDEDGYFQFANVVDGNYFLDAISSIDVTNSYTMGDAFIIYGIGNTFTGLQKLASDVDADNIVTQGDAFIVYGSFMAGHSKVSSWTAQDWFFDHQTVTVSGGTVTQDFSGIASGDADGDWVPIP